MIDFVPIISYIRPTYTSILRKCGCHICPLQRSGTGEKDFPTEQSGAQTPPWFPFAHGYKRWPFGSGASSRTWPQKPVCLRIIMTSLRPALSSLRVRRDYLAAAKAAKQVRRGLVLQARRRDTDEPTSTPIRFGLTASKKTGNAVTRNRIRRRLRALAHELLPQYGQTGYDYVMIGRVHTPARDWSALRKDLSSALKAIHTEKSEKE